MESIPPTLLRPFSGTEEDRPDQLHLAVMTGKIKKIKMLVSRGVHIESENNFGQSPLFVSAFGGDIEVSEALLRLGADPNRRSTCGAAPVHAAARRGSRTGLAALLRAGADLKLLDENGRLPRDYALMQQSPIRRQKILAFLDPLLAMACPMTDNSLTSQISVASQTVTSQTMTSQLPKAYRKGGFGMASSQGSLLSLAKKPWQQSVSSVVWSSRDDVTSVDDVMKFSSDDVLDSSFSGSESKTFRSSNLTSRTKHSVSNDTCDEVCVSSILPLLTPIQLHAPRHASPSYTCGGPTLYCSMRWLGTDVTVRKPTPDIAIDENGRPLPEEGAWCPADAEAVRCLVRETQVLRRLRHPSFLQLLAACRVPEPRPKQVHIAPVFQHVPLGSLYHHLHIKHRDLSLGGAVEIILCICEALQFLLARGWLHCGLTSHAVHLITPNCAKLGGFEYAIQSDVKGVNLRAEGLSSAPWLRPWQAPETMMEQMVSPKSEVYSLVALLWEIWAGMPPWAGISEDEILRRVCEGQRLPPVGNAPPSLVAYLAEYGLKWSSHHRELDIQEVHTMLRSLRIQSNEEERVPQVTSFGPPSIPNTPVVGRQGNKNDLLEASSSDNWRSGQGVEFGTQLGTQFGQCFERWGVKGRDDKKGDVGGIDRERSRDSGFCTSGSRTPSPKQKEAIMKNIVNRYTNALESSSVSSSPPNTEKSSSQTVSDSSDHSIDKNSPRVSKNQSASTDSLLDALIGPARNQSTKFKTMPTVGSSSEAAKKSAWKRSRKARKRNDVEFCAEFIDDEFDQTLLSQPHMQLSAHDLLLVSADSWSNLSVGTDGTQTASSSMEETTDVNDDDTPTKESPTSQTASPRLTKSVFSALARTHYLPEHFVTHSDLED